MTPKPLLFIEQPKLVNPHAPMQVEYHTPTVADHDTVEDNTNNQLDQKTDRSNEKQSDVFADMTIDEKLDYLLTRPPHVPRLYCKLTINQAYYRGHVLARKDEQFVLEDRQTRRRRLFKVKDISEIRLIGF